ncbi:MAG: DUF2149 domain-containing protein [bacterium]|nr:DUF2149 domain-containing protein [bacterium]
MQNSRINILDEEESDPMLSSVNLVDVFLVAMAILMIAVAQRSLTSTAEDNTTIIRNEGEPTMEIIVKDGKKLTRFKATGASSVGNGSKAGTAYRMRDGTMVYVPNNDSQQDTTSGNEP